MFEVINIIDAKRGYYRVRWAGIEPKTGKPWKPSWVKHKDCSEDVIQKWKTIRSSANQNGKRKAALAEPDSETLLLPHGRSNKKLRTEAVEGSSEEDQNSTEEEEEEDRSWEDKNEDEDESEEGEDRLGFGDPQFAKPILYAGCL